ncbi:MAG: hypothetical protein ACI8W3_000093 [Myxococcota bacterium]|jgi:hypothetical protein
MLRIALISPLIALTGLWACAVIWIDGPSSKALAGGIAALFVAGPAVAFAVQRSFGKAAAAHAVLFTLVLAWWISLSPSNDRQWLPEVAALPRVDIDGNNITVHNVRNFEWLSADTFAEHWETRSYDLSQLRGIDFYLSYWGSPNIAHTIVSWDFGDGKPLAISIETRKEVGEAYSAVLGFFRQFELYYVVADERDLIGVRTNHRGELVRRYRMKASPDISRAILLDYLKEINRLADEPSWYNAMTHNCTTTIRHHVQHVAPGNPFDWRILVNGHLDELGYMRGTIDNTLPFEEVRARANITEKAKAAGTASNFSDLIRAD